MSRRLCMVVAVGLGLTDAAALTAQETRHLQGRVFVATDTSALSDVRVALLGLPHRAETDTEGRFLLRDVPPGPLQLVFARIGIRTDTVAVAAADTFVVVYLEQAPVRLTPLEVITEGAARRRFELIAQTSTVSLDPLDVANTPTLGEPDVARTVQLLPGTVAKNDFYVGFNTRGGETDQNLIQLDGITVFNPSHVGGLFSTFDQTAIERVDYLTGGFPAHYGGRLSSVLDVRLRPGSRHETRFHGNLSLLSSKAVVEGPVGGTGISYLFGGRRSYADLLADPFLDPGLPYYFADAVGKVTALLPTGGSAALTAYWGRDDIDWPFVEGEPGEESLELDFNWGNRLVGLSVQHSFGALELEQRVGASAFATELAVVPDIRFLQNTARVHSADLSVGLTDGGANYLRVGGAVDAYRMYLTEGSSALGTVDVELEYRPTVWSGFADAQVRPFWRVQLRPGVRIERVTGGRDETTVAPRVAAKLFLTRSLALTGSAGRFYQAIHSIRDQEVPLTVFDFWIGADDVTPIGRSDHVVAGMEQWFGESLSLQAEAYYKTFDALAMQNFRDDPKVRGDEFVPADGWARGVDVMLRKYRGPITGWVAYTYGKTIRRTATDTFPPAHDRRHTLNIVVQAPGPWRSQLNVRYGYGSPLPYTQVVGQWLHRQYNSELHGFDWFDKESVSLQINGERYPYYSRLDVGLRWETYKWGGVLRPYVQIVNVFNQSNVWVYAFDYDRSPPTRSGLSQLPFFPTVGVEFEW